MSNYSLNVSNSSLYNEISLVGGCLPVSPNPISPNAVQAFLSIIFNLISFHAIQPFYGCQRNARKILPLLSRLGLVLRLGSV